MQACDRCHSRKTRCDRRIPQCSACEKAGAACLHVDKLRQRNVPRGYVDSMEIQVQKLAEENRKLRSELEAVSHSQLNKSPGRNESIESAATTNTYQNSTSPRDDDNPIAFSSPSRTVTSDVITEVEYLSLKATGETRYVGSSSGMGLASIIDSVVDSETRFSLSPTDRIEPDMRSTQIIASAPSDASFPPLNAAMAFVEAYFQHTHVTFPLLHRPSFLRNVEQIYNEPGYYESHPYESYTFNMVLAIGSSNFNRFEEAAAGPASHYARAQAKLNSVLCMKGLMPLKAIIILCHHGIFSNLKDTSASIYHLVGIGARICVEQGLHSDSKYTHNQQEAGVRTSRQHTFEEEMRRRCFWCLYNLDRVVSFTLGRPAALRDEDINVSLPSNLSDESFGPDNPIMPASGTEPQISPFLHLIRIRRLCGEIMSKFYSINQKRDVPLQEKIHAREKIHEELVSWRNDTQLLKLKDRATDERTYVSCFLTPEWYTAVFNNAMLLLYRPSPYLPHPTTPSSMDNEEGDHVKLFSAAKATILAYATLHRRRRLNYSWITFHGVFVAGLAYVYGVGRALKAPGELASMFDYLDIINDTRACSNVLVAISERWNMAHRSCELFNELSTAVIRDAVNATSNRRTGSTQGPETSSQIVENVTVPDAGNTEPRHSLLHYDQSIDIEMSSHELPPGHVSVIDEFRHYSTGFEGMLVGNETLPSELVTGFPEYWAFDDSFSYQGDNGTHLQNQNGLW